MLFFSLPQVKGICKLAFKEHLGYKRSFLVYYHTAIAIPRVDGGVDVFHVYPHPTRKHIFSVIHTPGEVLFKEERELFIANDTFPPNDIFGDDSPYVILHRIAVTHGLETQ